MVEVAGATPTVTWKVQGSPEQESVSDANSTWFDLIYVTDAVDTTAVTALTSTAVGKKVIFEDELSGFRQYHKLRLVTSANTNITYRGDLYEEIQS